MGDVGRDEGNPAGAHDTRPLILLGRDYVRGGVNVARMYRGERGDVGIKLPSDGPTEGCFVREVQVS